MRVCEGEACLCAALEKDVRHCFAQMEGRRLLSRCEGVRVCGCEGVEGVRV